MAFHTYGGNEELDSQISVFRKSEKCYKLYQDGKFRFQVYASSKEEAYTKAASHVKGEFSLVRFFQGVEHPEE